MRRLMPGAGWLVPVVVLAGCRTTTPGYQDWRDEAGFRVEATSRTFSAPIDSVCLAVNRAAEVVKLKSATLEIAAKLPDPDEAQPEKPNEPKRVAFYDNKSVLKSPLGTIKVELDKEGTKVDLDALTIHHARLVGVTAEGRSVQIRIDPAVETDGMVVAARVGSGQRLDGAASQEFLGRVAEALHSASGPPKPEERARLFADSAVFFDKKTDGELTKVALKVSMPKPSLFGRKAEPETK
jgi:hypothetical protein